MGKNGKGSYQEFWGRWMTIDSIKRHIENHRDGVYGKRKLLTLLDGKGFE
jgi:hypothetical protein